MSERIRMRRRQTTVFIVILFLFGISLIFLSAALNPSIELWSVAFWANFIRDVGFLFAPTAILTLLYESLAETKDTHEITDNVTSFLRQELDSRLSVSQASKDIITLYKGRYAIDFNSYFGSATESIDILVTNLQTVQMYIGVLLEKAVAGVKVRILALDPDHAFLANRFPEIGLRAGEQFRAEIVTALTGFCLARETGMPADLIDNFAIKVYRNPPTIMSFRKDDHIILAFILRQGRSRNQLHIEFKCTKGAIDKKSEASKPADAFVSHFDIVWQEADDISYDKVEAISKAKQVV